VFGAGALTAGGSFILLLVAVVLLLTGAGRARVTPSPPPGSPRLLAVAPVTVKAGQTVGLDVPVDRRAEAGPLVVRVTAPAGITCPDGTLAPEATTAHLELAAAPDAAPVEADLTLSLWAGGRKADEETVSVRVEMPALPRLAALPAVTLRPGEARGLDVAVDRRDYPGPLELRVDGPSGLVRPGVLPLAAGETSARLDLAAGAAAEPREVRLSLWAGQQKADEQVLTVRVEKPVPPRLVVAHTLSLQPGASRALAVEVQRQGYEGPVALALDGLPDGVTGSKARLAAGEDAVELKVEAAAGAAPGTSRVTVRATLDGPGPVEQEFVLTVEKPAAAATPAVKRRPGVAAPQAVQFQTADWVQLDGTFYPSDRGKQAPCVLLLHQLGGNSRQEGWEDLAADLQAAGYAVLAFDFRGHGKSTTVLPAFWTVPDNRKNVPVQEPGGLDFKTFPPAYYPALLGDIGAAKAYLDSRNDLGDCNSGNLVLIGAEDGATLGSLWLFAETCRFRAETLVPLKLAREPEGKDVCAAVWLGMSPTLGGHAQPVTTWVGHAGRERRVPMAFLYAAGDKTDAVFAQQCLEQARGPRTKLTGKRAVKDVNGAGHFLLGSAAERDWVMNTYLKEAMPERDPTAWEVHAGIRGMSYWVFPRSAKPLAAGALGGVGPVLYPFGIMGVR
jgi:pimeloyl-ACP methyl ester carboxylesterase